MAYTAPLLHPRDLINKFPEINRKTFAVLLNAKVGTINHWCAKPRTISQDNQTLRDVSPQVKRLAAEIAERLETDSNYRDRVLNEIQPQARYIDY